MPSSHSQGEYDARLFTSYFKEMRKKPHEQAVSLV